MQRLRLQVGALLLIMSFLLAAFAMTVSSASMTRSKDSLDDGYDDLPPNL
jgi:hypothetical protein